MPGVVVVGAGHAAVQLAASLRQGGYDGPIALVGDEPGLPYQRPPLSKLYLAGRMTEAALALRPDNFYAGQRIDLHPGDPAVAIDRAGRRITLRSGAGLDYDHLVLATGAANRELPLPGASLPGVFMLRTRAEADALRAAMQNATSAVVIGAGFIGMEFSAVACERGLAVGVIELAPRPLMRGVSEPMSNHITARHRDWGARFLTGTGVARITGERRAEGVETATGERIAADLVLIAAGVVPNTALAAAAGLPVENGILVDANLLTADPAISAMGDCVRFPSPFAEGPVLLESVQNAADQARAIADRLLGRPAPYDKVPWFWSDQGPLKLQIAGLAAGHDRTVLRGDPASGSFSVFCYRGERLLAIESMNRPADHMTARRLLAGPLRLPPSQAADEGFDLRAAAAG